MKFLERFALTIFSIIILILSVVMLGIMFDILSMKIVTNSISFVAEDITAFRTALVVIAICVLLAIKGIFFKSKKEDLSKDGIVLENGSGKLVISKESLENLVSSVSREIPGADVVSSRTVLDKDRNLRVFVTINVSKDTMLKDVSTDLQTKIKETMKRTADLDVKEVNIRIKNINSKKVKTKSGSENKNTKAKEPVEGEGNQPSSEVTTKEENNEENQEREE